MEIVKDTTQLVIKYTPHERYGDWVAGKIKNDEAISLIKGVFIFSKKDLKEIVENSSDEIPTYIFSLGELRNGYYRIRRRILNISHDALLHRKMEFSINTFVVDDNISVFRKIDELCDERIIIGGERDGAIPIKDFVQLLDTFPTYTERKHYVHSRITRILKDYLNTMSDAQRRLDNYLQKKKKIKSVSKVKDIKEYEVNKYAFIKNTIEDMLIDSDAYDEQSWQNIILDFILLLMPKYIICLSKIKIKDSYSIKGKIKKRECDFMLVDANGNIDIIEIKKPFANSLISQGTYRDNYTPKKELSGSVMQIEKYLFHLNKWGIDGEEELTKKYKHKLPKDLSISITNPKGLIILGRDKDFDEQQRFDFEIMRRKFANLIDIITYDDLLRRLEHTIAMLQKNP